MVLTYFNSVVSLQRLVLVMIFLSLSFFCAGQQGLSLNERLAKHALINQIEMPNANSEITVVEQLNQRRQLRSGNYTHQLDSIISESDFNPTTKVEYLYGENDVYAFYSVANDTSNLWQPQEYIYWEFDSSDNLIKNFFHDWNGEYVDINDTEPKTFILFEYNDLNQLVQSLTTFEPHLQSEVNYDTLTYSYNSEGLLSSRRRSLITEGFSSLIITQSESKYNYNDDNQIVSDSFFRYDQVADKIKNRSNQFFNYKDRLLINTTSENVISEFDKIPFDSITYEYLINDSIAKREIWKFDSEMKLNEDKRYKYESFDERLIDEINTVSLYNMNINDWQNKEKTEHEYVFFTPDSYSLSRTNSTDLVSQINFNSLFEFDDTVLKSNILFPPNIRYEYYHNHMITARYRDSNGVPTGKTNYFYSNRVVNTSDIEIENTISVFPNPFVDEIQIKSNNLNENFNLKIFSTNGMLLMNTFARSNETVNLSGLFPSTYIYVVESRRNTNSGIIFKN